MTHEQKPESAEFRTLETQVSECARDLHASLIALEEKLYVEFAEAEDRGAAKQRRKDAEGAEAVGYVRPDMMEFFRQSKALFTSASIIPKRDETHTEALYTRPANVAALEARVKELEGALDVLLNWADGQWCPHENTHRGGSIWTICNDCGRKWADDVKPFDPDEDFEPSAIKQACAAIREGGE